VQLGNEEKIDLPPEKALGRAMMVKPPADWKKALPKKKPAHQ